MGSARIQVAQTGRRGFELRAGARRKGSEQDDKRVRGAMHPVMLNGFPVKVNMLKEFTVWL
jgi:hypothetical protein